MASVKGILIISPFFSPNIGGVESHLDDLVTELNQKKVKSFVLTYSPLTTKTTYISNEKRGYCQIIRFKWFGHQLFPKLEKYPILDFLYLTPYLLIRSFIWLISNQHRISIIHSQGFNGAFIGNFLAKIFNKKHLCSTHAIYENINGFSRYLTVSVLSNTEHILCLSNKSQIQLVQWGIDPNKVSLYRYWINLKKFLPALPPKKISFLFVGRLITKKGINVFLEIATMFPLHQFVIVGTGPQEDKVKNFAKKHKNIQFLGAIKNNNLTSIYQRSNILCIASQYPEGYGRVVMEAVSCGLPVIGSNLGAIPEALGSSVSILFRPNIKNFAHYINEIIKNPKNYYQLQKNCRTFALKNFSNKNFETIYQNYLKLLNTN